MKELLYKIRNTALFALAVFALTWVCGRFLSLGDGAYIHAGDALLYLSVIVLPFPQALAASALGFFFADLSLGSGFLTATVVVKALTVTAAYLLSRLSSKPLVQDALICASGLVTVGGYALYSLILHGSQYVLYDLLQAGACAAIYLVVSGFVRGRKEKKNAKNDDSAVDDVCGPDADTPQS